MSPELQSAITTAELTLIPLAVGALAAWFKYVTDKLKAKDTEQRDAINNHAEAIEDIQGHAALSIPSLNGPIPTTLPSPAITPIAQPAPPKL